MTTERVQSIAETSASNLVEAFSEQEEEILRAIHTAAEEAQNDGKEACSITLSHSIKIDLTEGSLTDVLKVTSSTKSTVKSELPDPNQPDLFDKDGPGDR